VFRIEKLTRDHVLADFDCGVEPLNRFLINLALVSQQASVTQTYLALTDERVIGYHSLTVGDVKFDQAPERMKKGLAHHPVPVAVLARVAVDKGWRGIGAGQGLLKDAASRVVSVAEIAGVRALVVHAKDDEAKRFYEHFGFTAGFDNPLHLYMLMKNLRSFVR
jgi:GNAT superfamily N-acetyltransferase